VFKKKSGDKVAKGDVLAEVLGSDESKVNDAACALAGAISIGSSAPRGNGMIVARLTAPLAGTGRLPAVR
jgi:thymidine phosphorylase